MKLRLLLAIVLSMITLACLADENVVVYWLKKIGNGDNMCEPHAPYAILTKDISAYIQKIGSPNQNSFLSCMAVLDENYVYERNVNWVSIRGFKLKDVEKELIAKVLARRTPIINEYEYDKAVYPKGLPRLTYRIGSIIQEDYWGMFLFCVINNLIEENDTRFEMEVRDLLDYLCAPLPSGKSYWDYVTGKMEEADARWQSPDGMIRRLTTKSIEYLNLFRKSRGENEMDPYLNREHLITDYQFGKNCLYYQAEKWNEYLRTPPTEKEIERFNEISRQHRKERKKIEKDNEKILDEIALRNAMETLQQENISSQTREYLERWISHIKNKKYK